MEVGTYFKIVARYWWLVLLVTIAAGATTAVIDSTRHPTYTSHARMVAQPAAVVTDTRATIDLIGQMGTRYIMGTFAQAATRADVRNAALKVAGLTQQQAASYPLEANVLPDTAVIEVSGSGSDPNVLANYIDATIASTVANTRELFQVIELVPLEQAQVPTTPTSPVPTRDIPLGAGLGLVLGILLALSIDYLRQSKDVSVPELRPIVPLPGQVVREDRLLGTPGYQEPASNGHTQAQGYQQYLGRQEHKNGGALQPGHREEQYRD